jgi:hypothetical protein
MPSDTPRDSVLIARSIAFRALVLAAGMLDVQPLP